jgi:hypothetical protein
MIRNLFVLTFILMLSHIHVLIKMIVILCIFLLIILYYLLSLLILSFNRLHMLLVIRYCSSFSFFTHMIIIFFFH